jgi:hypothetical protein
MSALLIQEETEFITMETLFECREWPFSGWCGQVGYGPGVSVAWTRKGDVLAGEVRADRWGVHYLSQGATDFEVRDIPFEEFKKAPPARPAK